MKVYNEYNARTPRGVWRQLLLAPYRYPDADQNCLKELNATNPTGSSLMLLIPVPYSLLSLLPSIGGRVGVGLEGIRVEKGGRNRNHKVATSPVTWVFYPHVYYSPLCMCLVSKKARRENWGYSGVELGL